MPHHLRVTRGIYQVQLAVPERLREAVAQITGHSSSAQAWLIRSTGTGSLREAEGRRDEEIMPAFRTILKRAEIRCHPAKLAADLINPNLGLSEATASVLVQRTARRIALLGAQYGGFPPDSPEQLDDLVSAIRLILPRPTARAACADIRVRIVGAPADPPGDPVSVAQVIALWKADREPPPKPKAERNKASKMARLLAFLGKADLARVTADDLQRYKEHLVGAGGNNFARDHLIDIKALFAVAFNNRKLAENPAARIKLPGKRTKTPRDAFTDAEARTILISARNADPVVKWGNWLAAFSGMITEEIVDADTRDVEVVGGIPCFHVRPLHRAIVGAGDQNELKTEYRTRTLPLHPAIAHDFLEFVAGVRADYHGGGHGPLFPMIAPDRDGLRNGSASRQIMKFIRRLGVTDKEKVFYSWRHRVASQLEHMNPRPGPDTKRYITGHGPLDIHAKYYLEHPPHELKPFIDRLPDPTDPPDK